MKKVCISLLLLLGSIFYVHAQIITTIAGGVTGHGSYWGDGGPATSAAIGYFAGLAVDARGNIYISDANNQRIRKVDAITNIISTIAGTGTAGYNGDGIVATAAQLNGPESICFDNFRNLYIYDYGNNRIRRIDAITGLISTYAGNGIFGMTGDGGPATSAQIDGGEMIFDTSGNLYVTSTRKIRKIDPAGTITTFIGTGCVGVTGEGVLVTTTCLAEMRGLAIDRFGNLYIADSTASIRKINLNTGIITRIAGTGDGAVSPYSGDGMPGTACHIGPFDISVDDSGNVYIADYTNSRIEKVDTFGIIRTIAGTGVSGFGGDGGSATAAQISFPENVVLDRCGNVYIADFNNRRVRKVTYDTSCNPATLAANVTNQPSPNIYPNPAHDILHLEGNNMAYKLYNAIGSVALQGNMVRGSNEIDVSTLPAGMYILELCDDEGKRTVKKVLKE